MDNHMQHVQKLLEKLNFSNSAARKAVLRNLSNKEVKLLCEVCLNLVRGHLKIKDRKTFNKLKRGRRTLTYLADKRKPIRDKREILNQKGGFIGALAAAALPVVISEVARLFRK